MKFTEGQAKQLAAGAALVRSARLAEAADAGDHSHTDLCKWLSDALRDAYPPGSMWCYFVDFIGDGESGMVQYCCGGDLTQAPYTITQTEGAIDIQIDTDAAQDILCSTTYVPEAPGDGYYESAVTANLYTAGSVPLIERTISKDERDAASSADFAGKGKSFPILKKGDAKAAAASIGRAGSDNHPPEKLKANIKRIAKKKGLADELPKTWKDEEKSTEAAAKESGARHSKADQALVQDIHDKALELGAASPTAVQEADAKKAAQSMHDKAVTGKNQKSHDAAVKMGANCPDDCAMGEGNDAEEAALIATQGYRLVEGALLSTDFAFHEAAAISPIVKIISPGRGSSGYYTKEVLERDGPDIFKRGTLMFINHATDQENIQRPEGDWSKLAAVTEADAKWDDHGPEGPALYAPAAVFSKYAQEVKEKAPYTGVSINARGFYAESVTGKPNPKLKFNESAKAPDGKPGLIAKLTCADSIDLVTKAGRDGKLLLESANFNPQQEHSDMTEAEQTQLREAQSKAAAAEAQTRKFAERFALSDAAAALAGYFKTVNVAEGVRERVTNRLLARSIPMVEATGSLDSKKLLEFAEAEVKDEFAYLAQLNPRLVSGMGSMGQPAQRSPEQVKEAKKAQKKAMKETDQRFASVMGFGESIRKQGRKILSEGRGSFDPFYNARNKGAVDDGGQVLPGGAA